MLQLFCLFWTRLMSSEIRHCTVGTKCLSLNSLLVKVVQITSKR